MGKQSQSNLNMVSKNDRDKPSQIKLNWDKPSQTKLESEVII